jgi:hypothetical protein
MPWDVGKLKRWSVNLEDGVKFAVGGDAWIVVLIGWIGQEGFDDERYQLDGDLLDHASHFDDPPLCVL